MQNKAYTTLQLYMQKSVEGHVDSKEYLHIWKASIDDVVSMFRWFANIVGTTIVGFCRVSMHNGLFAAASCCPITLRRLLCASIMIRVVCSSPGIWSTSELSSPRSSLAAASVRNFCLFGGGSGALFLDLSYSV